MTAKMAALPANSRAESGLKPCFRFRPWNGFLRVPFHVFQTLFKQSFLGLSQRIVLIKPLIGIELSELETNLLPLFLSELGQFPAKSRLCSSLAFNRAARCCQDENWFVLSPLSSPTVGGSLSETNLHALQASRETYARASVTRASCPPQDGFAVANLTRRAGFPACRPCAGKMPARPNSQDGCVTGSSRAR
jgi:hypothetical protein